MLAADEQPQGGEAGPSLGPVLLQSGRTFVAALTTGIAQTPVAKLMLYLIDLSSGKTTQKVRLNEDGARIVLATSSQPCCMCYGATFWAGIDTLLIGARSEDVEELTEFDEGPLPVDWIGELARRGIAVRSDILRDQARAVLRDYGKLGVRNY